MNKETQLAVKLFQENNLLNPDYIDAIDTCITVVKESVIEDLLSGKQEIYRSMTCAFDEEKVAIKIWFKTGCKEFKMEIVPIPEGGNEVPKMNEDILVLKRGKCKLCAHYVRFSDGAKRCNFYPSMPANTKPEDYCIIDNVKSYGFKENEA